MTESLVGKVLDEYHLEALLGEGGMARVYRGLDTGLQRYAAIKVIDTPYRADESYNSRFELEARAIAQLDHPHIVTIYRYGRANHLLYLAMKYIEGADLSSVLAGYRGDDEFMPLAEVSRLVREIGSALDYAHSQGVIHRDVKPSNVMIDFQGRAFLTDFGLALLTDIGTQGEILGSPRYIAPEQAMSSAGAVPQSDLYALGVILYQMVTGVVPFTHDDLLELLMLHMTANPPSPRSLRPGIMPAVETVLLKALAKEPEARFASGVALADAFAEALSQTSVLTIDPVTTQSLVDKVVANTASLPLLQVPVVSSAVHESVPVERSASQGKRFGIAVPLFGFLGVVAFVVMLVVFWVFFNGGGFPAGINPTNTIPTTEEILVDGTPQETPTLLLSTTEASLTITATPTSQTVTIEPAASLASDATPVATDTSIAQPSTTPLPPLATSKTNLYFPIVQTGVRHP